MKKDCSNLVIRKEERHNGDMRGVVTQEEVLFLKGRRTKKQGGRKNKGHDIVPYLSFPVHSTFY
jgi:hypothetical protein